MGKTVRSLLTYGLLLVMTAMMINKAVYTHVHILPEGSLVSHAHPFDKGKEKKTQDCHQHSSWILYLLEQLEVLIYGAGIVYILLQTIYSTGLVSTATTSLRSAIVPIHLVRPPPVNM